MKASNEKFLILSFVVTVCMCNCYWVYLSFGRSPDLSEWRVQPKS